MQVYRKVNKLNALAKILFILNVITFVVGVSGLCHIFNNGYDTINDFWSSLAMTVISGWLILEEFSYEVTENE